VSQPSHRAGIAVATGVVVILVAGFVGWRLITADTTYAPKSPLADECGDVPDGASRVTVRADDGRTLGAALVGPRAASVGVVLRQGAGQTICDWLPWAGEVGEQTGARVLLFDRRGRGSSPGASDLTAEPGDVAAAVALLRSNGVRRVALVGSSMGNSVTFSSLKDLPAQPCALVAISPVLAAGDSKGMLDARAVRHYPRNIWVTWEAQNPAIVADVDHIRSQADAQGLPEPRLHGVDTHDHSIGLVDRHPDARDFVLDAIRSC
jgi:pimeloyl-ACP methyl ester carboxylesterase